MNFLNKIISKNKGLKCIIFLNSQVRKKSPSRPMQIFFKSTFSRNQSSRFSNIGTYGFLMMSIPIGTFCLGSWQVKRRQWKLGLIAELEEKMNHEPIELINHLDAVEDLEYRKVKVTGSFDHSKEMLLGPRSLLTKGDIPEGGLLSSGQSGFNIVTPFRLSNENLSILVNRGWVPYQKKHPSTRTSGQIDGPVELTGVVRLQENRGSFMPENRDNAPFLYRDVTKMSKISKTAPIFIDAVETFSGGPQGGQTRVVLRNEHMSYILTWYSLSLATSFLWFKKYFVGKLLI